MIFLVTSNNFLMLHSVPTTRYVVLKFALLYVSKDVTWTIFFTLHVPNFFLYYIYIGKPMHHVLHTPCPEFKACDFRWEQLHGFSFKPPKYICNCPYQISGHGVWSTCQEMFGSAPIYDVLPSSTRSSYTSTCKTEIFRTGEHRGKPCRICETKCLWTH